MKALNKNLMILLYIFASINIMSQFNPIRQNSKLDYIQGVIIDDIGNNRFNYHIVNHYKMLTFSTPKKISWKAPSYRYVGFNDIDPNKLNQERILDVSNFLFDEGENCVTIYKKNLDDKTGIFSDYEYMSLTLEEYEPGDPTILIGPNENIVVKKIATKPYSLNSLQKKYLNI